MKSEKPLNIFLKNDCCINWLSASYCNLVFKQASVVNSGKAAIPWFSYYQNPRLGISQ